MQTEPTGESASSHVNIWVAHTALRCCGPTFSIGDSVTWTVGPANRGWLTRLLGHHAKTIPLCYYDCAFPEESWSASGIVRDLRDVYCHGYRNLRTHEWVWDRPSRVIDFASYADGDTVRRAWPDQVGYIAHLELN